MKKVLWIIQQIDGVHYNWVAFYEAALKNHSQVVFRRIEELKTIRRSSNYPIIIGGEDYLCEAFKNAYLAQGIFLKNDFFRVDNYIACLGERFLNHDMQFFSIEDLLAIEDRAYFIRPLYDSKCFNGGVYHPSDEKFLSSLKCKNCVHLGEKCIGFSSVKNVEREWRTVIVKNSIASICRYAKSGLTSIDTKDIPDDLFGFCSQILKNISTPIAFVLDIVESDQKYKVLEFNIFNASNFYECDRAKIVRAVEAALQLEDV